MALDMGIRYWLADLAGADQPQPRRPWGERGGTSQTMPSASGSAVLRCDTA